MLSVCSTRNGQSSGHYSFTMKICQNIHSNPPSHYNHIRVANLGTDDSLYSAWTIHEKCFCDLSLSQNIPGILNVYVMSERTVPSNDDHQALVNLYRKGQNSAKRIMHFMGGLTRQSSGGHDKAAFVVIEDSAFVAEYCPERLASFQTLAFNYHGLGAENSFVSRQQLHFSVPGLDEESIYDGKKSAFEHVEIVSGICLFNSEIMNTSTQKRPDGRLTGLYFADPTLYEMEYIARASQAIADIVALLLAQKESKRAGSSNRHTSNFPTVRITLDIPSFHYYHTVLTFIEKQFCSFDEAIEWFDQVDRRHNQISTVFKATLLDQLHKRGFDPGQEFEINKFQDGITIAKIIRNRIERGDSVSVHDIMHSFNKNTNNTWNQFLTTMPPKDRPRDFRAFGYLSYIYQVVKSAFDPVNEPSPLKTKVSHTPTATKPRRLILSIDECCERLIYQKSQKALKKIRQMPGCPSTPTLVETYMAQKVFINNNSASSNLYLSDPTSSNRTVSLEGGDSLVSRLHASNNEHAIAQLYGSDLALELARRFREVGLGKL